MDKVRPVILVVPSLSENGIVKPLTDLELKTIGIFNLESIGDSIEYSEAIEEIKSKLEKIGEILCQPKNQSS